MKAAELLVLAEERANLMLDPAKKAEALVEILERTVWFFAKGNESVHPHTIGKLVNSINSILTSLSSPPVSDLSTTPGPLTGSVFGDNVMGAAAPGGIVGNGKVAEEASRAFTNAVQYLRDQIEEGRRSASGRWREVEI